MPGFAKGEKVRVRYSDTSRYPAIIIELIPRSPADDPDDGDRYKIRWDPPDPNLQPTWTAHEDLIERIKNDAAYRH
jgi:hypothetical protein